MFAGIVSSGKVVAAERRRGLRLAVDLGPQARHVQVGDSVAVNGICLTAIKRRGKDVAFEVMPETLSRTTVGSAKRGDRVNVELSLRLADRIGGHLVMGHIDGVGTVQRIERDGKYLKLWIAAPRSLTSLMVAKGAVALDGVSMTVVDVLPRSFSVCLIPATRTITTLGQKQVGDQVNIEADLMGKYVQAALAAAAPRRAPKRA
ncbi:MAG: riboflavin synthase [Candidatus Aenigmarchaeota archaeon]|nr:riboflavin synthase [Candidatus Aenigmarchaeota archaeon]